MAAVRSPEGTSRDPYELDRLAEELAARESSARTRTSGKQLNGTDSDADELSAAARDLPIYTPLSHDDPYLSAETFDVEQFLLSRAYTSLPDLRTELRDYLVALKEELVKLINDDYEAFISLSTDLRGEGTRLESLRRPLADLKAKVLESRSTLQRIQDETKEKLDRRAVIREEKAFLQSLLKISDSITRLESLLLISSPDDEEKGTSSAGAMQFASRIDGDADEKSRGNRAKHIARVAAEYTQLLYHVSRARTEPCAFIDESQWRIDRIKSTLSSDLDHLFATTLSALVGGKDHAGRPSKVSEIEKSKLYADVTECLRTYDVLGLWRDAEDVIRREVMRDFVKKTIYPGALSAPRSPIVPHTPFPPPGRATSPAPPQTASLPPRTPYTPFTAFASKQNPFEFTLRADSASASLASAAILDETDDPLAALYNTILRFVDRDLRRIMEIAEAVCVKSGSRTRRNAEDGEEPGFEIMANVVWSEIGRALMDELGSVIFAAGKPDDFRKHHETTQAFMRALEFLAPSVESVEAMRKHIVFAAFEKRWQLPVYFQLRWKEIVARLEEALVTTKLERSANKAIAPFVTAQAAATFDAIRTCWSAEVFIPELSSRFWRFSLQIISRYRTWLDKSLPPLEPPPKVAAAVAAERCTQTSAAAARASTPVPTEAASAESIAADEALLQQFATAITDIRAVETQVTKLWREQISALLPSSPPSEGEQSVSPEDALKHALSKLASLVPTLLSQIVQILSRRACDALLSMRSIPSQFRAMSSSKKMPTEPSYFVSLIFKHIKAFFAIQSVDGPGSALKDEYLKPIAEEVFDVVTERYIYFLSAMKKTEESLRKLKKGRRSAYSLFGSSAREDDGRADEEKIRTQMILDVEAFGREAEALGVSLNDNAGYRSLVEMARSGLADGECIFTQVLGGVS
ncbi:COG complex component [Trametes coccinea BRFM310]|uniref:Conserved oligomeric Golgi complex subunit 2 n=1 Tax=Trametes coccinea (strain BRFM310) TaxID=1353009 RepID=A0A1Y2J0S8_TRAC3|nr:COG complex component [Trametes coccinea BRFM310]